LSEKKAERYAGTPPPEFSTKPPASAIPDPLENQRVTQLAGGGPGDSPTLPKIHEDLLNDSLLDLKSRRAYRRPVAWAVLTLIAILTLNLSGIVGTLTYSFSQAVKPENIISLTKAELQEKIKQATAEKEKEKNKAPQKTPGNGQGNKDKHPSSEGGSDSHSEKSSADKNEPIKIEAKVFGEIRDSMIPLVALTSILTVAVVVLLSTLLKAVFAIHPNHISSPEKEDDTSPIPLLEALKNLVDSIKAIWK